MKKLILTLTLGLVGFANIAEARHRPHPRPFPRPEPVRILTVTGQGSGGTTHGDRQAACMRAEDRAYFDVAQACSNLRGNLVSSYTQSCMCHRVPRSRDDYNCRVDAVGRCEVGRRW